MITNIDIDTRDLSSQFDLDREDVNMLLEYTVKQVTAEFAYLWGREAKQSLKSTRNEYINAIQIDTRGRFTGVAYLNPAAWLPNALEVGASAYDMKQGLLSSPKAKMGKNGPYITIPFRFAGSGAIGESSVFSGIAPPEIERAVSKSTSRGGLSLSEIPTKYHIPKTRELQRGALESVAFDKRMNIQTKSIYEGLKKSISGGYINFRRVSLRSAPDSFQHPGFEARDFAYKALPKLDMEGLLTSSIDGFLTKLGL